MVKVCKIKGEEPSQIVQNCPDLEQYVQFLKLIDKVKADGQAQPLTRAIREAVRHNILRALKSSFNSRKRFQSTFQDVG